MKQNNVDYHTIIGSVLIGLLVLIYIYLTPPMQESSQVGKERKSEQLAQEKLPVQSFSPERSPQPKVSEFLNQGVAGETILENNVLKMKISNQGGQISEIFLKKHKAYDHTNPKKYRDLYLVKDSSFSFGLTFQTLMGSKADTRLLYFTPELKKNAEALHLTMWAKLPKGARIEYVYSIKNKEDYDVDFAIRTQGLSGFAQTRHIDLNWGQQALSFEKEKNWEESYTQLYYSYDKYSKVKYLSESGVDQERVENANWVANKQQFFTSILSSKAPFQVVDVRSSKSKSQTAIKTFSVRAPLSVENSELDFSGQWYFGPINHDLLKKYNQNFENIIPFGWGILKWLNTYFFLVIFQFLEKTQLNYGIIIILMTIVVKLILSPITYRQYKLSAMMKVIQPEVEALNEKYKNADPLKKQQVMMELYQKTGVNPMSGCLPALLQIPIFYSLFKFFPNMINLRGQSFLWADDLTSYDSIGQLPFSIPLYGDHVSLFTLLYAGALLLYTKVSGSNNISSPQQGMPDMRFMTYMMPLLMLWFINSYASGLSLYYFVSNMINIALIFIIKRFILDGEKIHQKIQENKAKPKKRGRWQERMQKLVEEARKQQVEQKARKK
ncbi:MAG: membrane protein insertase YidC [Flavobacteriales bacterium AspAUS03]